MTKHPASRRVHKQSTDEDAFVVAALETSVWAKNHQRIIIGATLAAAILLGGFLYYRNFQTNKAERAIAELTNVRQTVLQGNRNLAENDLQTYVNKYSGTAAADEARLMLAQVYLENNKPAEAIRTIEKLAGNPGKAGGATAALLLGAAYEAANQKDKAEATYLRVADKARFGFEKREALERAAALRLAANNAAGAAELYEQAMNTYPADAPERSVYEMRRAEVQAATGKTGS